MGGRAPPPREWRLPGSRLRIPLPPWRGGRAPRGRTKPVRSTQISRGLRDRRWRIARRCDLVRVHDLDLGEAPEVGRIHCKLLSARYATADLHRRRRKGFLVRTPPVARLEGGGPLPRL